MHRPLRSFASDRDEAFESIDRQVAEAGHPLRRLTPAQRRHYEQEVRFQDERAVSDAQLLALEQEE